MTVLFFLLSPISSNTNEFVLGVGSKGQITLLQENVRQFQKERLTISISQKIKKKKKPPLTLEPSRWAHLSMKPARPSHIRGGLLSLQQR